MRNWQMVFVSISGCVVEVVGKEWGKVWGLGQELLSFFF